jgi:hypothetical protein
MPGAPSTGSWRAPLSLALVVLAAALAFAGGVTLYVRTEIVASHAFADRAVDALERDPLRRVVSREITVQLVERGSADLVSARPVVESVVGFVVRTQPFRRVFRSAAFNANRLLFVREGGNAAFDLADVGTVVASALRGVSPTVARRIPPDAAARLLELRKRSFATSTLRFADHVRMLGIVLPLLAVVALAFAIAVAPDRPRAITRAGVALGVAGAALAIALVVARAYVVHHVYGSDEVTNAEVRDAAGALWDAYFHDLLVWALGLGALALVVGAASASLLQPFSAADSLARVRGRLRRPSPARHALQGLAAMALGVFVVLQPTLALSIAAVLAGALLLYYGAGEALSGVYAPERARAAGALAATRCPTPTRRAGSWSTSAARSCASCRTASGCS